MLGNEFQAKDVVQETMVSIWQKLQKIRSAEVYKTWVYRIVVNKCYDQMRKRKRNPEFVADDAIWQFLTNKIMEEPSAALENTETAMIITLLTEKLSSKQKAVFVLSELEGLSNEEVSDITGISKSAVKANLYYARKNISERMKKYV